MVYFGGRFVPSAMIVALAVLGNTQNSPPSEVTKKFVSRTREVAGSTTSLACWPPMREISRPCPPLTGPMLWTPGSVAMTRKAAARTFGGAGRSETRAVRASNVASRTKMGLDVGPPYLLPCSAALVTIHVFSAAVPVGSRLSCSKLTSAPPSTKCPGRGCSLGGGEGSLKILPPVFAPTSQVSPSRLVQVSQWSDGLSEITVLTYQ